MRRRRHTPVQAVWGSPGWLRGCADRRFAPPPPKSARPATHDVVERADFVRVTYPRSPLTLSHGPALQQASAAASVSSDN